MVSRDEQERRRREAIAEVGRRRKEFAQQQGQHMSQEAAERRVRRAVLKNEAQQG